MLQKLLIKNYALIEEIEIDFSPGFSIITGETGAGKSIILGALGLLLGARSDSKAIADKSKKTVIEATFVNVGELPAPFEEGERTEVIVRREITGGGRSRAFVDDSPVSLQQLSALTSRLLDIHSQHANLSLTSKSGQLDIIDAMSDTHSLLGAYRTLFKEYVGVRAELRRIKEMNEKNKERRSVIEFQLGELKKLNPKKGELEEVERRFELLSDADEIRAHLSEAYSHLDGHEMSALSLVKSASEELSMIDPRNLDEDLDEEERLLTRLHNVYVELKDIAETIESYAETIESSPALLASTGARMRQLLDAVKTFHTGDGDGLVELKDKLTQQLSRLDGGDEETKELEIRGRRLAKELKQKAEELTAMRKAGSERFAERLTEITRPLGLPNLRFEVGISSGKLTSDGQDTVEFLCSFNKNGEMLPMASTASGGELSRLTLGIKSLMASKMQMPTIIFDEIDTGVSGEIADKMGKMMEEMAENMQVITITHLPQVAARGSSHFKVYKRDTQERTVSDIKKLDREERIREVAGMLSGEHLTESAKKAAEELLDNKKR